MSEYFHTTNVNVAAFFVYSGEEDYKIEVYDGRIGTFIFANKERCLDLLDIYNHKHTSVNLRTLADKVKRLRYEAVQKGKQ